MPASRIAGSVIRQTAGVGRFYKSTQQWTQQVIDAFGDQRKPASVFCRREAQSAQPRYRREVEAFPVFQGARGHGNIVTQLEAQSAQTRAGASKFKEAANTIEQNRNLSEKVFGGIVSRQRNTYSSKGKLEADFTRSITTSDVLEIREPELLSREEEWQSTAVSGDVVTRSSARQDHRTEEQLKKGLRMDGRSAPAWVGAGLKGSGTRDGSPDAAQGNGSRHMHRAGATNEAITLLKSRLQRGITVDSYAYVEVLQMCLEQKDLVAGKQVHHCIIESGMNKNPYVVSSLLSLYIKCGGLLDARRVFDEVGKKNVITWNTMIAGYAKSDHAKSALELFKAMRQEGARPNEVTYVCILKACASALALPWGKEVHEFIKQTDFESDVRVGSALVHMYADCGSVNDARLVFDRMQKRDVVTWNIMIGGLAQHGCGHEAYRLFLQMKQGGFEPNAVTYLSILNPSASAGSLEWVRDVHGHARKSGLESDVRVGNALVHMYAEGGSIDDARLVFDRMQKRNVVTWSVMISGLAQHGCGYDALELFRKMNANLVKPNEVTFLAVFSACCHVGLVGDGRRHFATMMQDYGIKPNIKHYSAIVDLLGRAGHLEEARLFITTMPFEPDAVTWKTLLGACRTHGNVELGELAAKQVFKLEPKDAAAYILLSNIYAAAGKSEEVSFVRILMGKRGVRKDPGRSWIEVDNIIHKFVVGDKFHPETNAIYSYLKELTEELKAEGYIADTQLVLQNVDEETKELALCSHSERLAIAYGLMRGPQEKPIRVYKNLRVCPDCHTATKFISKVTGREIIARDANRFHHFKDGICSCGDYW